jgi:hypothetical protein
MQIRFVSLPRSGHHHIARLLTSTSGVSYCEGFSCQDAFSNPILNCPRQSLTPILHVFECWKGAQLTKGHDFSLNSPPPSEKSAMLCLYRKDVYASLISWYELEYTKGNLQEPDSQYQFKEFIQSKVEYVTGFANKYLNMPESPNFLLIQYENLYKSENGIETIKDILSFLGLSNIANSLNAQNLPPLKEPRNTATFRYYNENDSQYINKLFWMQKHS